MTDKNFLFLARRAMRRTLPETWEAVQGEVRRIEAELRCPLRVVMTDE